MGELRVTNAAGKVVGSLSGNQGDSWQAATVDVYSPSFAFEYTRGDGWEGDAAVALVAVSCGAAPPPPPPPPAAPPAAQPSPPALPKTTFDFSGGATSLGWSTGGGEPPYAFTKKEGGTWSVGTGPSAGVGGSGSYLYAEASHPRVQGDLFTLAYDGSACSDTGAAVSTVAFYYHMYGATMGELRVTNAAGKVLRVTNAAGEAAMSLSGNQGDSWQAATVDVYSPSFAFEYTRGDGWEGDAAVAQVTVSCGKEAPLL